MAQIKIFCNVASAFSKTSQYPRAIRILVKMLFEPFLKFHLLSEGSFGSSIFLSSFFKFGSSILFSAPATIEGVLEKPICIINNLFLKTWKRTTSYDMLLPTSKYIQYKQLDKCVNEELELNGVNWIEQALHNSTRFARALESGKELVQKSKLWHFYTRAASCKRVLEPRQNTRLQTWQFDKQQINGFIIV